MANKQYKIDIDLRLLELLGPSLYTNIYYILGELIANAYDADARNVYIIETKDSIIVEDDGSGMSYDDKDIENYLHVAKESRTTSENSKTPLGRFKMGRKGIGKLAALSVSENVFIRTRKNGDKSGFILTRKVPENGMLKSLKDNNIHFEKVTDHGTSIEMVNPSYSLPRTSDALKNNLTKLFPLIDKSFQVHIIKDGKDSVIDESQSSLVKRLGGLITYGEDFSKITTFFDKELKKKNSELCQSKDVISIPLTLKDKDGIQKDIKLNIKGWIGIYKTTTDQKRERKDFSDNFLAVYANKKLGEFNILPKVGRNKLNEVFIVGQLHVNEFEDTNFPDMALSNRQGYKDDDLRYKEFIRVVTDQIVPAILKLREDYSKLKKKEKDDKKYEQNRKNEQLLKENAEKFGENTIAEISENFQKRGNSNVSTEEITSIVKNSINRNLSSLDLKSTVDSQKKKVLISHTRKDKDFADIVYKMLQFNGFQISEILYTSADDIEAGIPMDKDIFKYLRDFFVDSISTQKIFVVYVTSKNMSSRWPVLSEIGAGWITQADHYILTLNDFEPDKPLDIGRLWQSTVSDSKSFYCNHQNLEMFCEMISNVCNYFGYIPKDKESNLEEIKRYIVEVDHNKLDEIKKDNLE